MVILAGSPDVGGIRDVHIMSHVPTLIASTSKTATARDMGSHPIGSAAQPITNSLPLVLGMSFH